MKKFLGQDAATQRLALEQTAALKAMDKLAVEKDFWVCWTLEQLFALPGVGECLTFKGGTSLSKAWGLIERFSEDIDLVLDKAWLGIEAANDPELAPNPAQLKKRLKLVEVLTSERITQSFLPALRDAIGGNLTHGAWSLEPDPMDPQVLLFRYPRLLVGEAAYLDPVVKPHPHPSFEALGLPALLSRRLSSKASFAISMMFGHMFSPLKMELKRN